MVSIVARTRSRTTRSIVSGPNACSSPSPGFLLSLPMASSSGTRRHAGPVAGQLRRMMTPSLHFSTRRPTLPCPWALHAMQLLAEHPEVSFGVHLTVVCEVSHYRCAPLTSRDKVASLVDASGFFYTIDQIPQWLAQVQL